MSPDHCALSHTRSFDLFGHTINKKKGVEASLAAGMTGRRSSRLPVFVLLWSWVTHRLFSFSFCQREGVQMHEVDTAQVTFEWRGCQCSECKTPQTCYKKSIFLTQKMYCVKRILITHTWVIVCALYRNIVLYVFYFSKDRGIIQRRRTAWAKPAF